MPNRTDAHALSSLAIRLIEGVMPKKRKKQNVETFILEMKHIMVPLVIVLNTISKLYALEKVDFFHQCIDFFSFLFPLFSMWRSALFLFRSSDVQVSHLFY